MTTNKNRPHRWAAIAMSVTLFALLPVVPATAQTCPFDDGNSQLTREGLVLTRYALGLTGTALVNGTDFLPTDAPTIQSSIACPSCGLNITGNTDGLGNPVVTVADATIISRKLAGMSGAALTNGVNLGTGTRNTTSAVNSFLLAGCGATGGTVTSVGSGTGLTGGPITTSGTIAADTTYLQRRVSGTCAVGSSIRVINGDGTVSCQLDSSGAANAFVQGGNTFGAPGVVGTTDAQSMTVQSGGSQVSLLIPGGNGLRVVKSTSPTNSDSPNVINGSANNAASAASIKSATIAGGGEASAVCSDPTGGIGASRSCGNVVTGDFGTIGGGGNNRAANTGTVSGGSANSATSQYAVIGGGTLNIADNTYSTIGGGGANRTSGQYGTISGGNSNDAGGLGVVIAGGRNNATTGGLSAISGGEDNLADGGWAVVPGGQANSASGTFSMAAGQRAKARGYGAFVWADGQNFSFDPALSGSFGSSNANVPPLNNTFIVRATGGVQFVTGINGSGIITQSCFIGPAGTGWSCASDRNLKHLIKEVSPKDILAKLLTVPVSTWAFKGFEMRQLGPMAQDFYRAFGLGDSDRHINSVDAQGVAFAAIQGLHQIVQDKDREIASLKRDRDASLAAIQAMKADLAAIRKHLRM